MGSGVLNPRPACPLVQQYSSRLPAKRKRVTVTVLPVTPTVLPVTSTVLPVTLTVLPVTPTILPMTPTALPVTLTVLPGHPRRFRERGRGTAGPHTCCPVPVWGPLLAPELLTSDPAVCDHHGVPGHVLCND